MLPEGNMFLLSLLSYCVFFIFPLVSAHAINTLAARDNNRDPPPEDVHKGPKNICGHEGDGHTPIKYIGFPENGVHCSMGNQSFSGEYLKKNLQWAVYYQPIGGYPKNLNPNKPKPIEFKAACPDDLSKIGSLPMYLGKDGHAEPWLGNHGHKKPGKYRQFDYGHCNDENKEFVFQYCGAGEHPEGSNDFHKCDDRD